VINRCIFISGFLGGVCQRGFALTWIKLFCKGSCAGGFPAATLIHIQHHLLPSRGESPHRSPHGKPWLLMAARREPGASQGHSHTARHPGTPAWVVRALGAPSAPEVRKVGAMPCRVTPRGASPWRPSPSSPFSPLWLGLKLMRYFGAEKPRLQNETSARGQNFNLFGP